MRLFSNSFPKLFFISLFITLFIHQSSSSMQRALNRIQQLTNHIVGSQNYTEFEQFAKKYAPPAELKKYIDDNPEALKKEYGTVPGLTSYYMKGSDIDRIINAERMRACIKKYNLDLLDVTQKYIYKDRVFAKTVSSNQGTTISLKLIQQLVKLAEETGFRDWNTNWIYDASRKKLICIDTENNSFVIGRYRMEDYPQHCKLQYVGSLMIWRNAMMPEAATWFQDHLNKLVKDQQATKASPILPNNTQFDDASLNFEEVKKQFNEINRQNTLAAQA